LDASFPVGGAGALLDLGAGTKPFAPVYSPHFGSCTSVDVPYSQHDIGSVDVLASADNLPFNEQSFDCVLCTEVLEHCPDPAAVLREVHRVLRPNGKVFLSTPFLVPLHEMPHDYYRFTPSALRYLASLSGLRVMSIQPKGDYRLVAFGMLTYPWSKLWQALGNRLWRGFYHSRNPLIWATLVLPQLLYTASWKRLQRKGSRRARRLYDKLSYITLGYVTVLARDETPPPLASTSPFA